MTAARGRLNLKAMKVILTPDQAALIHQAVETGRLEHKEDSLEEALQLWEERERRREEILSVVEAAEASLARGKGRVISRRSMRHLASQVKRRGRARLAAAK